MAAVLWLILKPWVSQRVLTFDLRLANTGQQWALEWQRAGSTIPNGVWLNLPDPPIPESEPLEIQILGTANGERKAVEFWLFHVYPLSQAKNPDGTPRYSKPDLKSIIAEGEPEQVRGNWMPFWADEGIVFSGEDGFLRFDAPPEGVRLHLAKTRESGRVRVRYANTEKILDLRAATTEYVRVELHRRIVLERATTHVSQGLPNYDLASVFLHWKDSCGATAEIGRVTLIEKVFGCPVRFRNLGLQVESGALLVTPARSVQQFDIRTDSGRIALSGRTAFGASTWVVGYAIIALALLLLRWIAVQIPRVRWSAAARHVSAVRLALLLVIGVRVWMLLWAPLLVSFDGVQYISNAQSFLETGSTEQFGGGGFRMPGYSFLLTVFLRSFRDFGLPLLAFQALLGLGVALFGYDMLKRVLPRPWPAVGLLYIGLDPVLLTYEHLALTECVSTFCVTLMTWLVVRRLAAPEGRLGLWRALAGAAALGFLCAASAYVRSSLQVFFVAIPLAVLLAEWRRGARASAVACAVAMVLFSVVCTLPWIERNARLGGRAEFSPYGAIQKLASLWDANALDLNQTAAYSLERWKGIEAAGYFSHTYLWELMQQSDLAQARGRDLWTSQEMKSKFLYAEAVARRPANVLHGALVAFCNQIGLWNKLAQHSGRENVVWSRALRGDPGTPTNLFDGPAVGEYDAARERLPHIARSISGLRTSANAMWFNDLFFTYELTRPGVAILFLIGLVLAVIRRCYPIGLVGLICMAHVAAISILVLSAIDRYGVPFKPLLAIVAVWALQQLLSRRRSAATQQPMGA